MRLLMCLVVLLLGCTEKPKSPPRAVPQPLEPLARVEFDAGDERDGLHHVVPFTPVGPPVPEGIAQVQLHGETWSELLAQGPVLLVPDEDTFLVQAAPLLARLDGEQREVWLKHPDAALAYKVTLRDTASFQAWLDELVPGKVRVIHREDGFELSTNLGKLPGGDPNGPTVPLRGGQLDLTTLRAGFSKVQGRFRTAPDVCFVPSFGMELSKAVRAMAANYFDDGQPYFAEVCLVYPRPK